MDNLFDLDPLVPPPPAKGVRMLFGTVETSSPLTVVVDGDSAAVPATSCVTASVGDRVVMLLQSRVLVAIGVVS